MHGNLGALGQRMMHALDALTLLQLLHKHGLGAGQQPCWARIAARPAKNQIMRNLTARDTEMRHTGTRCSVRRLTCS